MKALLLGTVAVLQGAPAGPEPQAAEAAAAPAAVVRPWEGSFAEGLRAVRADAEAGRFDEAIAVADRLTAPNGLARWIESQRERGAWRARCGRAVERVGDALDLVGAPPAVRAEAHHARAMALSLGSTLAEEGELQSGLRAAASEACQRALVLAGPGALRGEAAYELARLALVEAEALRAKIPEISGQPAAPAPQPLAGGGGPGTEPPDPLKIARAAYLRARERSIERLRLDWRDGDAQANTELIQRRLRELEAIEQKRKAEQQKQDEQSKDEKQQKDQEDQKPGEDGKQDEQQPDRKPDEPEPDPKQDPEPPEEEPKPDEQQEAQPPKPKPGEEQAQPMSKEEMMQLLERLQKIEEVQKELQERLKKMRRVAVKKDW